jgi:hypothetical protein
MGEQMKNPDLSVEEFKIGICENCKDDYDEPKETKLYYVYKEWVCGDCACMWKAEIEQMDYEGRFDE